MNEKIVACIPVRGGSKRIPRKNMLVLEGETLIARKIRQLKDFATVVVGSDDNEMLEEASKHGAFAVRRQCTNEGADSANSMIKEFMGLIADHNPDVVIWAHCTNPFISTSTYKKALEEFDNGLREGFDSLVSVHEIHGHYWQNNNPLYPLDKCKIKHICANDLSPLYEQDGGIFIQPYWRMKDNNYFFGDKPKLFVVPEEEFCDVNTPKDWLIAQTLASLQSL